MCPPPRTMKKWPRVHLWRVLFPPVSLLQAGLLVTSSPLSSCDDRTRLFLMTDDVPVTERHVCSMTTITSIMKALLVLIPQWNLASCVHMYSLIVPGLTTHTVKKLQLYYKQQQPSNMQSEAKQVLIINHVISWAWLQYQHASDFSWDFSRAAMLSCSTDRTYKLLDSQQETFLSSQKSRSPAKPIEVSKSCHNLWTKL